MSTTFNLKKYYDKKIKKNRLGKLYDYSKFEKLVLEQVSKNSELDLELAADRFLQKYGNLGGELIKFRNILKYLNKNVEVEAELVKISEIKKSSSGNQYCKLFLKDMDSLEIFNAWVFEPAIELLEPLVAGDFVTLNLRVKPGRGGNNARPLLSVNGIIKTDSVSRDEVYTTFELLENTEIKQGNFKFKILDISQRINVAYEFRGKSVSYSAYFLLLSDGPIRKIARYIGEDIEVLGLKKSGVYECKNLRIISRRDALFGIQQYTSFKELDKKNANIVDNSLYYNILDDSDISKMRSYKLDYKDTEIINKAELGEAPKQILEYVFEDIEGRECRFRDFSDFISQAGINFESGQIKKCLFDNFILTKYNQTYQLSKTHFSQLALA